MIGRMTEPKLKPTYRRVRVATTVLLTDEQYEACRKLADMLGHSGETPHQRIVAMLTGAAHNKAYYAHEDMEDDA